MCLTVPAKILDTDGKTATVEENGTKLSVGLSLTGPAHPGDWLLHINGMAVKLISAEDAEEILFLLKDRPSIHTDSLSKEFKDIVAASGERELMEGEIRCLLETDGTEKEALLSEADTVRRAYLKDFICIHGIIEFSNHCRLDCSYCGLNSTNTTIERYRMDPAEIVECAVTASRERGYKLLVLQSGEDPFYTDEIMEDILRRIKLKARVFIFLSIGSRSLESYRRLKRAGASGVLFRFETSNRDLFKRLHPKGKNLDDRLRVLDRLKKLGFFIATGSLTGLPGQSSTDIARDLRLIKRYANMASIGPFIPSPGTGLSAEAPGDSELWLKAVAVLRLMMRKTRIPVVTAFETLTGEAGRRRALRSGANSLMTNLTPEQYRTLYRLYPDKFHDEGSRLEALGLYRYAGSYRMLDERMKAELSK